MVRIETKLDSLISKIEGTGSHNPGLVNRVERLEHQTISKKAIITATTLIAAMCGIAANAVATIAQGWRQ
jgi:hypothetical protein